MADSEYLTTREAAAYCRYKHPNALRTAASRGLVRPVGRRGGRLMRPHPGKGQPVLFDVVDTAVPPLLRQYRERRRLYNRLLQPSAA